jgi:hypothetical protein
LSKLKNAKFSSGLQEQLNVLSSSFIASFIDQDHQMFDLERFYSSEFWDAIEKAEVTSGISSARVAKQKTISYQDDVFQVTTSMQRQRYDTYIGEVRKAIEGILSRTDELLPPHIKASALNRFDVLFSGQIYDIKLVLMTCAQV